MARAKVIIAGVQYGKGDFSKKWTALVSSYEVGVKVRAADAAFLVEACGMVERYAKIMSRGRVEFKVVNKVFNGRRVKGIALVTPNSGYEVWVGKSQLMDRLFPRTLLRDESKENRKRALRALRAIIDPQIKEFRMANIENLRGGFYHIDHVYPFKLLVQEWCRKEGLDLETIPVKCRGMFCQLSSVSMAESWFDYHALNAKLQILNAAENLSKGSKYFGETVTLPESGQLPEQPSD
jgi:hypothetical protein